MWEMKKVVVIACFSTNNLYVMRKLECENLMAAVERNLAEAGRVII